MSEDKPRVRRDAPEDEVKMAARLEARKKSTAVKEKERQRSKILKV